MADDIDALLEAHAAEDGSDIDALLDAHAASPEPVMNAPLSMTFEERAAALKKSQQFGLHEDLPWYRSFAQGFADPIVGAGQLAQHSLPDAVLNAARPAANLLAGGTDQDNKVSTEQFDKQVRNSYEGAYQGQRANAGESENFDWWRLAGTVANPITWLNPAKGAGLVQAITAGAKAGAFQALLQPVRSSGSFIWDKGMQGVLGGAFGGTLGGAFAKLSPLLAQGSSYVAGKLASGAQSAATAIGGKIGQALSNVADKLGGTTQSAEAAATQVTDDALRAVGADPAKVDPIIYRSMRDEVMDAAKLGVRPDPAVMANKADAAALPIPMQYTRGQATRDNLLYSWEINNAKQPGYEELNNTLVNQNRQLVDNINELGAGKALSPFEASQQAIQHLEQTDAALKQGVTDAYDKVKNHAGQSALMDSADFVKNAREGLKNGGMGLEDFLLRGSPVTAEILNALELGKTPLTVNSMQQLDKQLYSEIAASTNGNVRTALGKVRDALNNAKLSDTLGDDAMQLYKTAKGLHAQRMSLLEEKPGNENFSPAYKAVVDGKAEAEKFFAQYVAGANVSQLPQLKNLLGPDLTKTIQNTAVGQLKKSAIGVASDNNAVFAQDGYNKMIHSNVMGPRLRELLKDDPERLAQLYRLGRVAENIGKYPKGHNVGTSNTATVGAEILRKAAEASQRGASQIPFVGGVIDSLRESSERAALRKTVHETVNTGVTREPLRPRPSKTTARLSDLLSRSAGAVVPQDDE